MSLKELKILPTYSTDDENNTPADTFYNPVLSQAKTYKRVAGYFSSTSFAFIGEGLKKFILNGGKMQFIFNVQLSNDDYENILLGFADPELIIQSKFLNDFSTFEDECIYNHAKVLGWLIAKKHLDIKIGYITKKTDTDVIPGAGPILHQKLGIIEDSDGNKVAFNGSNNESANGWMYNNEYLTAFCSWKKGHGEYVNEISYNFDTLWNNQAKRTKVVSFPEAVSEKLISISPKNEFELVEILEEIIQQRKKKQFIDDGCSKDFTQYNEPGSIKLRDYQIQAVDAWLNNKCTGIFEMATGTGKTITAVATYHRLLQRENNLILLITVPYSHLPFQWENVMRKMDSGTTDYLRADSTVAGWDELIYKAAFRAYNSKTRRRNIVIFATNDTASSERFHTLYLKIQDSVAKGIWMIISDEVHTIGTPLYQRALCKEYTYRLGLSATPERYFDKEGTSCIKEYFGDTVFEFTLREAMDTMNPDTGYPYLVSYEYHIEFCRLTKDEAERYLDLSRKIAGLKANIEHEGWNQEKEDQLQTWYNNRAKIIKNASNKIKVFDHIIDEIITKRELSHLLIYCSDSDPKQMESVSEHLDIISRKRRHLIKYKRYTQEISARVSKKTGSSERELVLKEFDNGDFDVLLAMKCLDEGVDVPSIQTAILMCSSGNPKEYIQRRGRILRPYSGKEKAILYDIAVLPPLDPKGENSNKLGDILLKERKRLEEFAKDSLNKPNIAILIENYLNQNTGK